MAHFLEKRRRSGHLHVTTMLPELRLSPEQLMAGQLLEDAREERARRKAKRIAEKEERLRPRRYVPKEGETFK